MPTDKRARQKAARRERREREMKAAKRQRQIRRVAIIAVVAAVVVGSIWLLQGRSSTKKPASTTTTLAPTATVAAQAKADKAAVAAGCPASPTTRTNTLTWTSAPAMSIDTTKTYTATVTTDLGAFVITLDAKNAPKTVNSFVFLSQQGYYHCVSFHRVIPSFMDQTGDPQGTGTGGPGYTIPDENLPTGTPSYPLGSVAMANTGSANSGGSQFFLVTGPEGEKLPATFSLFGQVTSGMDIVNQINQDGSAAGVPPTVTHRVLTVTIATR